MTTFFPHVFGHNKIQQYLAAAIDNKRIANTILFYGEEGLGKSTAALDLASRITGTTRIWDEQIASHWLTVEGDNIESLYRSPDGKIFYMKPQHMELNMEQFRLLLENIIILDDTPHVCIIDEAQSMGAAIANAWLKTLEEPPEHVKFILATTEPQKLPATILSRCQRFDFKRIGNEDIIKRLEIVCKESNIEITKEALNIIAILSEGAMRDALSILERCIQDGENKIDEDKIKDLVGIPKRVFVHDIINAIIDYDVDNALITVNKVLDEGKDISNLLWEIIKYAKDILLYKATQKVELYSDEEISKIKEISEKAEKERLINLVYEFSELGNEIKYSTQKNIIFQAGIIKLCNNISNTNSPELEQRINKIEKYLKTHNVSNNINQYQNVQQTAQTKVTYNNNLKYNDVNKKINTPKESKMKTSSYSNKIEEYWPQIVKDLKQNGKIVLYTNLMNTSAEQIYKFNKYTSKRNK